MARKVTPLKPVSRKKKATKLSRKHLVNAFSQIVRARLIDEKTIVLYKQNKCHFQIGTAGHEAVQVAAGTIFNPEKDWSYPYYRDMAYCAALGMSTRDFMLNAMNKKDDPNSHGRQMPMHYGSKELRIVNQSSPTGTQFLQAVGVALGAKLEGLDDVVYVSAGEGTCSQGDFHEALNWAAREKLAVVFLIQNNKFAISVPVEEQLAGKSVYKISAGYENLGRYQVDGSDYLASYEVLEEAYKRALSGQGPALVEAHVARLQSHSISDNQKKYRTERDIKADQAKDPVAVLEKYLIRKKIVSESKIAQLKDEIKDEVDSAAEWAEAQADCSVDDAYTYNFADSYDNSDMPELQASGEPIYMVDALNHALDEEMERNPDMYIFGQDVAHGKGGVFTVTSNLTERHGLERCFNAPLAEASIAGVAVGMASRGLKPVAEIQFGDYVWTAMMQIRNELAMMHYRSAGDFSCPAVIRIPIGGYIHGGCYHSQNIEATFSHFPGLIVLLPSNATDAKGLLKSAIRAKDPVLFLEHKGLYRQVYAMGNEGDSEFLTPIGKAKIVRPGNSATIVTWGALVNKSMLAAEELAKDGVEVEVVDVRTIVPLDMNTITESVKKTGRVLIAHEDVQFMGFGAEIAAQIASDCFEYLDAPVKRIGMKYAAAVGHSPVIEKEVLPQNDDVLEALSELVAY